MKKAHEAILYEGDEFTLEEKQKILRLAYTGYYGTQDKWDRAAHVMGIVWLIAHYPIGHSLRAEIKKQVRRKLAH